MAGNERVTVTQSLNHNLRRSTGCGICRSSSAKQEISDVALQVSPNAKKHPTGPGYAPRPAGSQGPLAALAPSHARTSPGILLGIVLSTEHYTSILVLSTTAKVLHYS